MRRISATEQPHWLRNTSSVVVGITLEQTKRNINCQPGTKIDYLHRFSDASGRWLAIGVVDFRIKKHDLDNRLNGKNLSRVWQLELII